MNQKEYQKRLKVIDDKRNAKVNQLNEDFAFANNPYKNGDLITDHAGSIIIEDSEWFVGICDDYPQMIYWGECVYFDGRKKGRKRNVQQNNLIKSKCRRGPIKYKPTTKMRRTK